MNLNTASQNQGVIAWDGTASHPVDIRRHAHFSFTFETTADLAADASFKVQAAPADDADPCAPGDFVDVPETLICSAWWGEQPNTTTGFVIPKNTKKGAICTATLPCKPDAFVQLVATGAAAVKAVAVLSGPR
jgi:hypothetical protein